MDAVLPCGQASCFPGINAVLHLWCYVLGLIMALLNKPVKIMHHER